MIASRALARAAVLLASGLLVSCGLFSTQPSPSPSPSASPTRSRPRFELSTYQYALQTRGKIRVAVRDGNTFAPLSSGSVQGKVEGFEADLARELARAIWGTSDDPDSHIQWISVDNSTAVAALTSNQADVTIAGLLTGDDANKKVIDLSDSYLRTGPRLLVKKANTTIKEISDVASGEQTVCAAKQGRPAQELRKITNNGAKVLELETLDFCMQALSTGAADAVAADETTLFGIVLRQPNDVKLVGNRFADDTLGIGIKKNASGDRQGFLEFVNGTLQRIVADRTWAKLYEKHITPASGERKQTPTD